MSIIYSRPRIKLPKFFIINNKKRSLKNKKIFKFLFVLLVIFIIVFIVVRAVTPVFNRLCSNRAKSVATIITNEETTNAIKDYKYSDFIIIHKDNNSGNILMLESNMKNINNVTSDVAYKIQTTINNTQDEDITISLGSFTGISILSGRGYKIPIRISTIGAVKTNVKSEFVSQGINQTLHRLYLEIECEISVLTPFNTINESITNQLILAENVIVGEIPEAYYNINGVSESDAMNLIG